MARKPRIDIGGQVYHIINRASGRVPIFNTKKDYIAFERVLAEAVSLFGVRLLAYCVMPNHFHLAIYTEHDGQMQKFVGWLTKTHTQRWHAAHGTVGYGHVYQGRYKSFLVNTDEYYISLMRYIEQNPLRAKLVERVQDWQWCSFYRRVYGSTQEKGMLSAWLIDEPKTYRHEINILLSAERLTEVRNSIIKNAPLGGEKWRNDLIQSFKLEHTLRSAGRPKSKNGS